MNFNRKELIAAVIAATRVCMKRSVQPILECVRISFNDLSAQVISTDLDVWFKQTLYSGGATGTYAPVCLKAKQLLQVLKSKNDELVLIATACNITTVDGMVVESYDAQDYPAMPVLEPVDEAWETMPALELQRVIDQAAWAARDYSIDHSVLGAVLFKSAEVCATDGSRLSVLNLDIWGKWHLDCMVPATVLIKQVQPLLKAAIKAGNAIRLNPTTIFSAPALAIEGANWTVIVRLIAGQYPRYSELIPQQTVSFVTFAKADMLAALKQLKPFVNKRTNLIHIDPETNTVSVDKDHKVHMTLTMSKDLDQTVASAVVGWRCNLNYLLQAVESINHDYIHVQYEAPTKPLIFIAPNYQHLLMPAQSKENMEADKVENIRRAALLAKAVS